MAKKSKKRQQLSKRKQTELLRKQGYSYKQINSMKSDTRKKISELIITDNKVKKQEKKVVDSRQKAPKKSHYDSFKTRVSNKRLELHALGIDKAMVKGAISDKKIDSIKLSDIKNGRVNRENYPWLFVSKEFDFDKIYKLKNNERMFVAFRDYQGELDFSELLEQYSKYNNGALIDGLESIVNTPPSYQKGVSGSSSGRAGDYKFQVAPEEVIKIFNQEAYNETRRDKRALQNQRKGKRKKNDRRQHYKGEAVGFQVMKDGNRVSHSEVTPRNLLIMANALMYNITEQERGNFYTRFYTDIIKHIPEMVEILPKPKF